MPEGIPHLLLERLQKIESDVAFIGVPPKIRSSSGKIYFVKTGFAHDKEQYIGEVESLKVIEAAAPGFAPRVLSFEIDDGDRPTFIAEYKELSHIRDSASGKALATRLATELHAYKSKNGFGFHVPTYCGATKLNHRWHASWEECFGNMMEDLLDQLRRSGAYEVLCRKGAEVIKVVIPRLLGRLKIEPVLLHGDLWSGNVGVDQVENRPIVIDPSSFYGHNEADLAIARIFGGFPSSFFETYHALRPKSHPVDQYDLRGDLYELFHYLNHTLLFRGGYANSAEKVMNRLLVAVGRETCEGLADEHR